MNSKSVDNYPQGAYLIHESSNMNGVTTLMGSILWHFYRNNILYEINNINIVIVLILFLFQCLDIFTHMLIHVSVNRY